MNEVKKPRKPLLFYYGIVMALLMLFNIFALPNMISQQIKEVDYGTFMSMTEDKKIGLVEIQDNQIVFTDKAGENIYKTGLVNDPGMTERLYKSGAKFSKEIVKEASPLATILISWVLPTLMFIAIGQMLSKQMMKKMGGSNSMMFNMGKSNAKVYVKSSNGIKFSDVAGEDEAKENLTEIVDYLHNPKNIPKSVLQCQKASCL